MSEPKKEKSLIDLAREHMEEAGADPETGVDVPESPGAYREEVQKPIHKEVVPEEKAPTVKESFEGKLSDAVASLLENIEEKEEWRALELPSRGRAYVDCEDTIHIKPFTFAEERKLRSIKKASQGTRVIAALIATCTRGLDYDSMTLEDKNYILFKLREISYGDQYTINSDCEGCESQNSLVVDISNVPVTYTEEDYEEPLIVELPDSKQIVKFVTPRCKDEDYITDMEKLTGNLWRFALSVGEFSDKKIIKSFFEKTTVKDIAFFREEITKDRYGMNKTMSYECANCGEINESLIPFTESFFSVS